MKAMVMPIPVREPKALEGLKPSMFVDFTLVVEKDRSYAENVRVHEYENLAQEPLLVRRLATACQTRQVEPSAGAACHRRSRFRISRSPIRPGSA